MIVVVFHLEINPVSTYREHRSMPQTNYFFILIKIIIDDMMMMIGNDDDPNRFILFLHKMVPRVIPMRDILSEAIYHRSDHTCDYEPNNHYFSPRSNVTVTSPSE